MEDKALLEKQQVKKNLKGKKKRRRRNRLKVKPVKVHEDSCFRCDRGGELILCDRVGCSKVYHLTCLGLDAVPKGHWDCPWHFCDECNRFAVSLCVDCDNSFCPRHAQGNMGWLDGRFICEDHEVSDGADMSLYLPSMVIGDERAAVEASMPGCGHLGAVESRSSAEAPCGKEIDVGVTTPTTIGSISESAPSSHLHKTAPTSIKQRHSTSSSTAPANKVAASKKDTTPSSNIGEKRRKMNQSKDASAFSQEISPVAIQDALGIEQGSKAPNEISQVDTLPLADVPQYNGDVSMPGVATSLSGGATERLGGLRQHKDTGVPLSNIDDGAVPLVQVAPSGTPGSPPEITINGVLRSPRRKSRSPQKIDSSLSGLAYVNSRVVPYPPPSPPTKPLPLLADAALAAARHNIHSTKLVDTALKHLNSLNRKVVSKRMTGIVEMDDHCLEKLDDPGEHKGIICGTNHLLSKMSPPSSRNSSSRLRRHATPIRSNAALIGSEDRVGGGIRSGQRADSDAAFSIGSPAVPPVVVSLVGHPENHRLGENEVGVTVFGLPNGVSPDHHLVNGATSGSNPRSWNSVGDASAAFPLAYQLGQP